MFTYKKVGGLHHVKLGRLGFSFYWSSKKAKPRVRHERGVRSVIIEGRRVFAIQ